MLEQIEKKWDVSRRSFLALTGVTAAAAALGCTACSGLNEDAESNTSDTNEGSDQGEWRVGNCTSYVCGSGRCVNRVLVKDNTIVRQKTDDSTEDSLLNPQQRGCARGRSQRKTVTGVDRLKYPMKRKNWQPGGGENSNGHLRGVDEWERISWDEALDLTASEFNRVLKDYGNSAITATWGFGYPRFLDAIGGANRFWGPISLGAWSVSVTHLMGLHHMQLYLGSPNTVNDRLDYLNSKLIVMFGNNPAWSSANSLYFFENAKQAGAKIIIVDPMYSATAISIADEWIPVRPSTDAALLIGMAYHMIENDLQDQEFLDTYCVGFDAEHMPEFAQGEESFKEYVLGERDDLPKTPEWASAICGVDAAKIRSFAEEIATTKPMAFMSAYAPSRTYNGEIFCQAFSTVGWMTGNVGKPGACVGVSCNVNQFNQGPLLVTAGTDGLPSYENSIMPYDYFALSSPPPDDDSWHSPVIDEAWQAILEEEFSAGTRGRESFNIKIISHMGAGNALNQFPDINKGIEAHRKVDFVVGSDLVPTPSMQYCDIILPVTHCWERVGSFNGLAITNRERFIWGHQVIEPTFEARDDSWIEKELAGRLGLDSDEYLPFGETQIMFNQVASATIMKDDGVEYESLAQITEEDLDYYGVDGEEQNGRIPIRELHDRGNYHFMRSEDDNHSYIAFKDYIDDPKAHPLETETGKFEIYCRALSDQVAGYGWTTIAPIAKYQELPRGFESTKQGEFPLQLITPHYMRRAHSSLDSNPWMREAFTQEVFINTRDAEARGLKEGDPIRIFNEHGSCLRNISVTERIMPGVVAMGEGAWVDIDPDTGYDRGGATNVLMGSTPNGQGTQGWNTNTVEVEFSDAGLQADCVREPKEIS